jgi:hypothetical protein
MYLNLCSSAKSADNLFFRGSQSEPGVMTPFGLLALRLDPASSLDYDHFI